MKINLKSYPIYEGFSALFSDLQKYLFYWCSYLNRIFYEFTQKSLYSKPCWSQSRHVVSGPQGCSSGLECWEKSCWWRCLGWTAPSPSRYWRSKRSPRALGWRNVWRREHRRPWRCWSPPACTLTFARSFQVQVVHPPPPWTGSCCQSPGRWWRPPRHQIHLLQDPDQCMGNTPQGGRS